MQLLDQMARINLVLKEFPKLSSKVAESFCIPTSKGRMPPLYPQPHWHSGAVSVLGLVVLKDVVMSTA